MTKRCGAIIVCLGLVWFGCGSGQGKPAEPSPLAEALACNSPPPAITEKAPLPDRKPPAPGPSSEASIKAMELFRAENWSQARTAFETANQSETDPAARQQNQYNLGIVLYRLNDIPAATRTFVEIGSQRDHARHQDALLWLLKVADKHPGGMQLAWFTAYDERDLSSLDNQSQRHAFYKLAFLFARRHYDAGELDLASDLFLQFPTDSPFHTASQHCLEQIAAAKRKSWHEGEKH